MRAAGYCIAASLLLNAGAVRASGSREVDREAEEIVSAPVVIDGVPLLRVHALSTLSAPERARRIADRIADVAGDPSFDAASGRVVEGEAGSEIVAGDRRLMIVTDADASAEHVARASLAAAYRDEVGDAIRRFRADRTPAALRQGILGSLLVVALLSAFLVLAVAVGRRMDRAVEKRVHGRLRSVRIKSFKLLDAERIWSAVRASLAALRVVLIITGCYLALAQVLRLFPGTRGTAQHLLSYVLGPLRSLARAAAATVPDLVFLAVLVFIVRWVLKAMRRFFEAVEGGSVALGGFAPDWALPTYRLVRILVLAFAAVVAYPYIPGSSSGAFKAVSVFAGILFSLGSSSVVASVIAGYAMTYRRTFRIGDRVKIGDVIGDVESVGVTVTRVRTTQNEEAVIPNSAILQANVVNYSAHAQQEGVILHTRVGIGYEVPWRQVEAMLLLAADRTPQVRREPRPFVRQLGLRDFCVDYELNAYSGDARAMLDTYSALHRNVLDVFNEYGVQIMTPAYMSDPPAPKMVPRDQWYAAPAAIEPADPGPAERLSSAAPAK